MREKKILFGRYPSDIIICIILSLIFIPLIVFDIESVLRIFIALAVIFFIPGYLLLYILFPQGFQSKKDFDITKRIVLSIVTSMGIISFIGIIYSFISVKPFSPRVLLSILALIIIEGLFALVMWRKIDSDKRHDADFKIRLPKFERRFDKILISIVFILIILIIIVVSSIVFLPKNDERFTEFYLLDENGEVSDYPRDLKAGENTNFTIGIINREQKIMNYTVEIWAINETVKQNILTNKDENVINHAWFIKKESVTLSPFSDGDDIDWKPQWEKIFPFNYKRTGSYKLMFLLFIGETEDFRTDRNYKDTIESIINNAYRELHVWINVK